MLGTPVNAIVNDVLIDVRGLGQGLALPSRLLLHEFRHVGVRTEFFS